MNLLDQERIREGHYLALLFRGEVANQPDWFIFRVLGREATRLEYRLDYNSTTSTHAAAATTAAWDAVQDTNNDHQLSPKDSEQSFMINQIFYGISPTEAEIYSQFESGQDRGSLLMSRAVNGAVQNRVGYWTGVDSSKEDPSAITELITINQKYPTFKGYNPTGATITITLDFFINKYRYEIVNDANKIRDFMMGDRRLKVYTMGNVNSPMQPPKWLTDSFKGIPKNSKDFEVIRR